MGKASAKEYMWPVVAHGAQSLPRITTSSLRTKTETLSVVEGGVEWAPSPVALLMREELCGAQPPSAVVLMRHPIQAAMAMPSAPNPVDSEPTF
jgi:hypothetical protein